MEKELGGGKENKRDRWKGRGEEEQDDGAGKAALLERRRSHKQADLAIL